MQQLYQSDSMCPTNLNRPVSLSPAHLPSANVPHSAKKFLIVSSSMLKETVPTKILVQHSGFGDTAWGWGLTSYSKIFSHRPESPKVSPPNATAAS